MIVLCEATAMTIEHARLYQEITRRIVAEADPVEIGFLCRST
jgi:hypothetical protein